MSSHMSEFVDPWRLASSGRELSDAVDVVEFKRLATVVPKGQQGEVSYQLAFSWDEFRRPRAVGRIQAGLSLQCQRCMEIFSYPVDSRIDVTVIEVDDEAERLDESTDPLISESGRISLMQLLEEELLLAIPQIPRHSDEACAIRWENRQAPEEENLDQDAAGNPFAVLRQLGKDS